MAQQGNVWAVEGGDNLAAIAKKVYGDERMFAEILRLNGGSTLIRPGMVLKLPTLNRNVFISNDAASDMNMMTTDQLRGFYKQEGNDASATAWISNLQGGAAANWQKSQAYLDAFGTSKDSTGKSVGDALKNAPFKPDNKGEDMRVPEATTSSLPATNPTMAFANKPPTVATYGQEKRATRQEYVSSPTIKSPTNSVEQMFSNPFAKAPVAGGPKVMASMSKQEISRLSDSANPYGMSSNINGGAVPPYNPAAHYTATHTTVGFETKIITPKDGKISSLLELAADFQDMTKTPPTSLKARTINAFAYAQTNGIPISILHANTIISLYELKTNSDVYNLIVEATKGKYTANDYAKDAAEATTSVEEKRKSFMENIMNLGGGFFPTQMDYRDPLAREGRLKRPGSGGGGGGGGGGDASLYQDVNFGGSFVFRGF